MPFEATRSESFEQWDQDALPLLRAADASEVALRDMGFTDVGVQITLSWPTARLTERSTQDARKALRTGGALQSAQVRVSVSMFESEDAPHVSIDGMPGWLHIGVDGADSDQVDRVFEAAFAAAQPAGEKAPKPSINTDPAQVSASPRSDSAAQRAINWIEAHPAFTGALVAAASVVVAVVAIFAG